MPALTRRSERQKISGHQGAASTAEERVRAPDAAALDLLDPLGPGELCEGEPAEKDRTERLHVEADVRAAGSSCAPARPRSSTSPTLSGKRGSETDVEREPAVPHVAPRRERSADVDEPQPESVSTLARSRFTPRDDLQQRMVEREEPCVKLVHPVDLEQEPPDLSGRPCVDPDRLDHAQRLSPLAAL